MNSEMPIRSEGEASEAVDGRAPSGDPDGAQVRVQPETPPPRPPVQIVTPIRIAIFLVILLRGFLFAHHRGWFTHKPDAREARQTGLVEVAPLQIDATTSPLAGSVGTDSDGYPTQYVDQAVLRAMLTRKRYDDLTKTFEQFQNAFEADFKHENWIIDAGDAFHSSEPEIKSQLDAWVAASPNSFAPYLARGSHWDAVGFARRGSKFVTETPTGDLKGMEDAFNLATEDLARATSFRAKLVAAKRYQIRIAAASTGRAAMDQSFNEALAICSECFEARVTYLVYSAPKWGGSLALMDTAAHAAPVAKNSKLRLLPGYTELENRLIANSHSDWNEALAATERACAFGENADFLVARALTRGRTNDVAGAKVDVERANVLRPKQAELLTARGYFGLRSQDFEGAARALLDALRIEPTNDRARINYRKTLEGVIYLIQKNHHDGNDKEALRIADLGAELAPSNREIQQWRTWIVSGAAPGAVVEKAAETIPEDIEEVRKMDSSLSRENKYGDILPLWDAYLAKHPGDGRAYLERGNTQLHLGQRDLAGQDALKACDLGIDEGCQHARELGM